MAANTDKFKRLARKWVGSIGAGGVADGTVTTIPLSSSSGLPTDTAVVATIDRVDANGVATPSLEESVVGVVSGDNLVTCTRGVEGTAQAHSAGAVVEILFTNKVWGDLIDGILAEHSQAGAHTTDTISEKTADAGVTVDGVKMKDNQIQTAGAVIGNALASGAFIVKTKTLGSTFSTNSSTNVDITGLSVSITPPCDGIIIGIVTADCYNDTINCYAALSLSIGGTDKAVDVNNYMAVAGTRNTITTFAFASASSGVATTVQGRGRMAVGGNAHYISDCCHIMGIFIPKASS